MSTAIEFNHISKQYRLGFVSAKTLSSDLNRWWQMNVLRREDPYLKVGETNDRTKKALSDFVWALRDVDFKVEQGDVVGIIGKNGAGKSTLLKLLSRVTTPTMGTIRARGRIASLLEVGTGFHQELTGRENVYMNGAILGMTRQEINRKLDEIVDFSGCERYIDTPVKRYSSGMMVRLGFAVAAHLDPEILVVDEVLAVGDAEFQKKAIGKMQDVSKGEGRTVLFVSHNMDSIRNLCTQGFVLDKGRVCYSGTAGEAVDFYLQENALDSVRNIKVDGKKYFHASSLTSNRKMEFLEFSLLNDPRSIASSDPITFDVTIKRNSPLTSDFQCAVILHDNLERRFATYTTPLMHAPEGKDVFKVRLCLTDHHLAKGLYRVHFDLGIKDYAFCIENYDSIANTFLLDVNLLRRDPDVAFAAWDPSFGYTLSQETLSISIL